MQIRVRGNRILCIKTKYSDEHKRTFGKTVASFDKYETTVPDDVRRQLEKEDVDQLQKWLDDRAEKERVDFLSGRLTNASQSLSWMIEALSDDRIKSGLSSEQAAAVFEQIKELRKALKRAGYAPEGQTAKKPVDSQQ